jgi:hypothetical protein
MKRLSTIGRRVVAVATVALASFAFMGSQAEAGNPYGYYGRHGGYGVGYRHVNPYQYGHYGHQGHYDWHDTSHYDWHDTSHFHQIGPFRVLHRTGHYDFHPQGHWDHHGGHHHH